MYISEDIKVYDSSNDPTNEKNKFPSVLDVPLKLQLPDYYTKPEISELESKERAEPGFCSHVNDFVIGRHGYGSIKFLGETDVRRLDLESFVQFNNREVIVYMDDTKKPPVGQGLNKPAEITLLNIKCIDKRSGVEYKDGLKIDKYIEMLKRKVVAQGGEFISYDPVEGEWKFRVQHFWTLFSWWFIDVDISSNGWSLYFAYVIRRMFMVVSFLFVFCNNVNGKCKKYLCMFINLFIIAPCMRVGKVCCG